MAVRVKKGTNERGDFDQIQKRMYKEDKIIDPQERNFDVADEINLRIGLFNMGFGLLNVLNLHTVNI